MSYGRDEVLGNFRTERYGKLNDCRWNHFLGLDIPLKNKRIFEPGAGVGDQTEWLLNQGAAHIYVNEGRMENISIIRDRFHDEPRVSILHGQLESCLAFPEFDLHVDLVFCYGVYYHLREDLEFTIMGQLSKIGDTIAFDYLAGNDNEVAYGYDNPSTAMTGYALRPRPETMTAALKKYFAFAYDPREPLEWVDPIASEQRIVAVASHFKLDSPDLIQI